MKINNINLKEFFLVLIGLTLIVVPLSLKLLDNIKKTEEIKNEESASNNIIDITNSSEYINTNEITSTNITYTSDVINNENTSLVVTSNRSEIMTSSITSTKNYYEKTSNATEKRTTSSTKISSIKTTLGTTGSTTQSTSKKSSITNNTTNKTTTRSSIVTTKSTTTTVVNLNSIILNKTSLIMNVGDTYALTYSLNPSNAKVNSVVWSSNNNNVVSVNNGIITANNAGSAEISLTINNINVKCDVIVNKKSYKGIFIGNSKTYREEIPVKVSKFASKSGITLNETYFTWSSGLTLNEIAARSEFKTASAKSYDFAVLQEQTTAYKNISENCDTYRNGVKKIINALKVKNPNIKIYLRKVWVTDHSSANTIMNGYTCTNRIASEFGLTIINDGPAMYYAQSIGRKVFVSPNDSTESGQHQNQHGSLLSSACIFATIFDIDPIVVSYDDGLTYGTVMKSIASTYCYRNNINYETIVY